MARRKSRNPRLVEALHRRRIEAAVRRHAPAIWQATRRLHAKWLKGMLSMARAPYERLLIDQRSSGLDPVSRRALYDFEIQWLMSELERAGVVISVEELLASPELAASIGQLSTSAPQGAGFLKSDPRTGRLVADAHAILEDQVSAYWQTLTDPEALARRLVKLKADGVPYVEAARTISREYGTEFYRAERLIRSAYNSASNHANLEAIIEAGFQNKRWLTSRDARVRRPTPSSPFDHKSAEGQVVPVHAPFIVSGEPLMFPGDSSRGASISNTVNCRCTAVGVD